MNSFSLTSHYLPSGQILLITLADALYNFIQGMLYTHELQLQIISKIHPNASGYLAVSSMVE